MDAAAKARAKHAEKKRKAIEGLDKHYAAFSTSRHIGKCFRCNARVELPCRACRVRLLMELGAVEPLPPMNPETRDGHYAAHRAH
jgi:hypothetical protein